MRWWDRLRRHGGPHRPAITLEATALRVWQLDADGNVDRSAPGYRFPPPTPPAPPPRPPDERPLAPWLKRWPAVWLNPSEVTELRGILGELRVDGGARHQAKVDRAIHLLARPERGS